MKKINKKNKLNTKKAPINEKPWDNRDNTDKYRVLATDTVIKQLNEGEKNNETNAASVALATKNAADK